jgi:chloramphenicol 3-O phosphotransferase
LNKFLKILKLLFFTAAAIFIFLVFTNKFKKNLTRTEQAIIILNGPSSSGKSSIAKKLEEKLFPQYLKIGADEFVQMLMPQKLFNFNPKGDQPRDIEALRFIKADGEKGPKLITKTGKSALMVGCLMPVIVKALANEGYSIIVDAGITTNVDWLKCFVRELKNFKVYFVKITAPLSVLEQREKQRKGFIGLSRGQSEDMQDNEKKYNISFDLALDSSKITPEQGAEEIVKFISEYPKPEAFKKLINKKFNI